MRRDKLRQSGNAVAGTEAPAGLAWETAGTGSQRSTGMREGQPMSAVEEQIKNQTSSNKTQIHNSSTKLRSELHKNPLLRGTHQDGALQSCVLPP